MLNRSQLPVIMLIDAFDKAVKVLASNSAPLQERLPLAWEEIHSVQNHPDYCHLPSKVQATIAEIESVLGTRDRIGGLGEQLTVRELESLATKIVDLYGDSIAIGRNWAKEVKLRIGT